MLNLIASVLKESRWKFSSARHNNLDAALRSSYHTTAAHVVDGDLPINFLFNFKGKSLPLVVFFHGAVDQSKTQIPHYVGASLAARLNFNSVHIADPSLNRSTELRSCWYLGTDSTDFQVSLANLISHIASSTMAPRTVLFGSSAGGFPCLALVSKLKNCTSVVNSPCTSLLEHPNKTLIESFESHCLQRREIAEFLQTRFLCANHNFEILDGNFLVYLMNIGDQHNIKSFATSFFSQFNIPFPDQTGDYFFPKGELIVRDWGRGHRYPPVDFLIEKIRAEGTRQFGITEEVL